MKKSPIPDVISENVSLDAHRFAERNLTSALRSMGREDKEQAVYELLSSAFDAGRRFEKSE